MIATAIGWAIGFAFYAVSGLLTSRLGWVSDAPSIAFWSATFVIATWLCMFVPFVSLFRPSSPLLTLPWAPLFAGACGLFAFALLLALLGGIGLLRSPFYVSYAAIVGSSTGCAYALLTRRWTAN